MVNRKARRGDKQNGKKPELNPVKEIEVTIDGRKFVPAGERRSFEQDIHMMDLLENMGMNDIDPKIFAGTFNAQRETFKLISKAYKSGSLFEMLGTAMVEEGKEEEWSPEVAQEVGDLFRGTMDKKARYTLEQNMVVLLLDFFRSALASQNSFPSFSAEAPVVGNEKSAAEELSTLESGSQSSERFRKATRIAQDRLSSGR